MLEREQELGGAVRTAELTEPGYLHDVFSAWHPLWVGGAAHAELGAELAERGLEYLNTDLPTATLFPDGEAAFLLRSTEANEAELGPEWRGVVESFLPNADLAFGVLGTELWSDGVGLALRAYRRSLAPVASRFHARHRARHQPRLATSTFASRRAHGLLAPWVLHRSRAGRCRLGLHDGGDRVRRQEEDPIPRGVAHGSSGARPADRGLLAGLSRRHGTSSASSSRTAARRRARHGRRGLRARRAVIARVTPTQLYGRLLEGPRRGLGRRFRYGRAECEIHFALSSRLAGKATSGSAGL